ncbi:MFS general substrate transporter [Nemania sp. FL0916]|nr:MFS general substrate transporter [Nemania sp. FL0916]
MAASQSDSADPAPAAPSPDPSPSKPTRSPLFWGTFAALCIISFICALDAIIITTALPTIIASVGGATEYVWIANSFIVASAVLQPLFGQIADVFGRRLPFIASTVLFVVGSGVAGGSRNAAMLIGGRTVQGLGAGGLYVLLDIICCDLTSLRERGKFVGLMSSFAGLAAALGPALGGVIAQADWRWIFWLNLPIGGVALVLILFFMRVNTGSSTGKDLGGSKLSRLDYLGSIIFVPSTISILLGLIMGGVQFPWSSFRIIVPIVLGVAGWVGFLVQQRFSPRPMVPGRLFTNRTSVVGFFLTFISSALIQGVSYFLPIYFQAVLNTTPTGSGTNFLPYAIGTLFFAVLGGVLLSKFGHYKYLHAISFAFAAIGFGLFTLLDTNTPKVAWAFFELISSFGLGITVSTLLPSIMAGLPESDVASITAVYVFIKTIGYVWGVTIASIIFNAAFDARLHLISDPSLRVQVSGGAAYAFAANLHKLQGTLDPDSVRELHRVYLSSLEIIWWTGLGVSIVGFFVVWIEKSLVLRDSLETEYGLQSEKPDRTLNVSQRSELSDLEQGKK